MANYLVTDTELTSVANAIRTKGGTTGGLVFPSGFISAINAISGGDTHLELIKEESLGAIQHSTSTATTVKTIDITSYDNDCFIVLITSDQESGYFGTVSVCMPFETEGVMQGTVSNICITHSGISGGTSQGVYTKTYNYQNSIEIAAKKTTGSGTIDGNYAYSLYKLSFD